jgi:hypothetical protein
MNKRILVMALFATMSASGQSTLVSPNANAAAEGVEVDEYTFGGNPDTVQWQIPGSQLTGMTGDLITALGFRMAAGQGSASGDTFSSWDLELSAAANPFGSLSGTFANNIGAGGVTVYDGSLTVSGTGGSNPFFLVDLTTPSCIREGTF